MKIVLQKDFVVTMKDGRSDMHKSGEVLSVYHRVGRKLILGRLAKWISAEDGDPLWTPAPLLRAAIPQTDKMIRTAVNK